MGILNNASCSSGRGKAIDSSDSPVADLSAMKDDARSLCVLAINDESARTKKRARRTRMPLKVFGTWVRIRFLYSELKASLSRSEGHVLFTPPGFCPSCMGLRPTSRGPGRCSVLHHSLIFQMQWRAKPICHWVPAKHFQLWHMWTHSVKCHDNSYGPVTLQISCHHNTQKITGYVLY